MVFFKQVDSAIHHECILDDKVTLIQEYHDVQTSKLLSIKTDIKITDEATKGKSLLDSNNHHNYNDWLFCSCCNYRLAGLLQLPNKNCSTQGIFLWEDQQRQ